VVKLALVIAHRSNFLTTVMRRNSGMAVITSLILTRQYALDR
jgi:hypothetical protein